MLADLCNVIGVNLEKCSSSLNLFIISHFIFVSSAQRDGVVSGEEEKVEDKS
jgi:hypothetical protein